MIMADLTDAQVKRAAEVAMDLFLNMIKNSPNEKLDENELLNYVIRMAVIYVKFRWRDGVKLMDEKIKL